MKLNSKEALKVIILGTNVDTRRSSIKEVDDAIATIEKELKALETIKDLNLFGVEEDENGLCWLVYLGQGIGITKEQYDLLKEYFK